MQWSSMLDKCDTSTIEIISEIIQTKDCVCVLLKKLYKPSKHSKHMPKEKMVIFSLITYLSMGAKQFPPVTWTIETFPIEKKKVLLF